MKTKMPIGNIIETVADSLRGYQIDRPMIRESLNDEVDRRVKEGFWVSDRWSQDKAVRQVIRSIRGGRP